MNVVFRSACLQNVSLGATPSSSQCKACYSSDGCCPAGLVSAAGMVQGWDMCDSSWSSLVHCVPYNQGCALQWWRLYVAVLVPVGSVLFACVLWAALAPNKNHEKHKKTHRHTNGI